MRLIQDLTFLACSQNIEMKIKLQTMHSELKQYKRLLMESQAAIDSLQQLLSQKSTCDLQHGMTPEQEQEFKKAMAERQDLRSLLEKLDDQVQSLQAQLAAKEQELDQMQSNHALTNEYEAQLDELRNQLLEYQKNETRLLEQSKMDEQWEIRCRELERELGTSLDIRSELEQVKQKSLCPLGKLRNKRRLGYLSFCFFYKINRRNCRWSDLKKKKTRMN